MWEVDIPGPLLKSPGAVKYLLVVIEYFNKSTEAKPPWEITTNELEMMQSYPLRVLDRRLQEDWDRATKERPRVLMNLRVDF